jgi:hypothetical protein
LPTRRWIVVNYTDTQASLRCTPRRRQPRRPSANHQHIAHVTIHRGHCSQNAQKNKAHIKSLFVFFVPLVIFLVLFVIL